ncbi:hypothetical protein Scep_012330 [Stephania cephalantha]|uniref:Uncharacterized protein n=1 Tax=Stephania cephalantha TaxID=152367 RepID=A0AAP0P6E0_9MAGN
MKYTALCEKLGDNINSNLKVNREVAVDGKGGLGRHFSCSCTGRELTLKFSEFVRNTTDMHPEANRGSPKIVASSGNAYFETNPLTIDHCM